MTGELTYSEAPTIVYTPVGGEQFSTRMLEPVGLHTLGLLSQGGWNLDRLLRLCVQRINGVWNAENRYRTGPPGSRPGVRDIPPGRRDPARPGSEEAARLRVRSQREGSFSRVPDRVRDRARGQSTARGAAAFRGSGHRPDRGELLHHRRQAYPWGIATSPSSPGRCWPPCSI